MRTPFEQSVEAAVCGGVDSLLQQQDRDGFWREFELAPAASEAWTTGWVGWCLTRAVSDARRQARIRAACTRAVASLSRSRGAGGWGYSRSTGPDADTTSWVLRFLGAYGVRVDPIPYLGPYVDAGGGVHSFRELEFGAWTDAHDDVAANAGLALLTTPSAQPMVDRIKCRLVGRFPGETYWWSTPFYGVAWTLRFLAASRGLSPDIRLRARRWISDRPASESGFDVAHRLLAVSQSENCAGDAVGLVNQLLDLAGPHGWPGGSFLLVPPRDGGPRASPNPELRGLMTTAICVRILSEWLESQ